MSKKLTVILTILISQISLAQDCEIEISVLSNILDGEYELVEASEYNSIENLSDEIIKFEPRSELEFNKKYPEIFRLKDSCYYFPTNPNIAIGIKEPELKACKFLMKEKGYSDYEFKGTYSGNALIKITEFERWGFLSVDLKSGLTFYTMGKPLTSNGVTAISYSNYYGAEEIALTDLKTKKQYVIEIGDWRTIESKITGGVYWLKLEPAFKTECKKEYKYLKIGVKN